MNNFIGKYKIDEEVCDDVLKFFNKNKKRHVKGVLGTGNVVKERKDSIDIPINGSDAIGDLLKEYFEELSFCLNKYKKKYVYSDLEQSSYHLSGCNIQKYNPGGGFKYWHYENTGTEPVGIRRHLVFMTYLNTCKKAGTMFYYQNKTYECQKGNTLIWPAQWTHSHRGVINDKEIKYIITGWYSYA